MKPNIGLSDASRNASCAILNTVLADMHVLYVKTRNYHWNVTGQGFYGLHKLFEEHYNLLAEEIDEVAERIRAIGSRAPGSMAEFLRLTRLKEAPVELPKSSDMVNDIAVDYEMLIRALREEAEQPAEAGDQGTTDFLSELMVNFEKRAWMLRASLEKPAS